MQTRIWLSPPELDGAERQALMAALDSNWIAPKGPHLEAFEHQLAGLLGLSSVLAVNSGTAAIHLALLALKVAPGDLVLCPTHTYIASANPISYIGARPVFIDAGPADYHFDAQQLEEAIGYCKKQFGKLPKAAIVAHLYGLAAPIKGIADVCEAHGIALLEDAAEGLGATLEGKMLGAFGAVGCLSFNGNKIITTSAGGALVTNDETLHVKSLHLATQAREPVSHFEHAEIGYNYRLSNLLAALGSAQLARLEEKVERKRAVWDYYHSRLCKLPGLQFVLEPGGVRGSRWLTTIHLQPGSAPAEAYPESVRQRLAAHGIEARPTWKPMHLQPLYAPAAFVGNRNHSHAEHWFRTGLCLPSGTNLKPEHQDEICALIEAFWQ